MQRALLPRCPPIIAEVGPFLQRLQATNAHLNAFISLVDEPSLQRSNTLSPPGRLAGLTVGIKDNIHVLGYATTCASAMLRGTLLRDTVHGPLLIVLDCRL